MNILKSKEALKLSDGTSVSGLVLMGEYTAQPTKNGGSYLSGNLQAVGDVNFKVWSGACYNNMQATNYTGKIVAINAEVNEYGGTKSLILTSIYDPNIEDLKGTSEADFFATRYDIEAYWTKLAARIQKNVSPDAWDVYCLLLKGYLERFKIEFAASFYHDNCKGGLLAHTSKVVNICSLMKMYPNIQARVSNDLLYVGSAIHDLGKVIEYNNGVISDVGKYVSHTAIGIEILHEYKEEIIEKKGKDYYYMLLSIVSQHHGDSGERPRTIAAWVIHQFDVLDSMLTMLDQDLANSTGDQINFDGYKLS